MADLIFPGTTATGPVGNLPDNVDLQIWQGDRVHFFLLFQDSDNNAVDLSTVTVDAVMRQDFAATVEVPFTCTPTGVLGQVEVYLPTSVSATLSPGSYIWSVSLTETNGDVRTMAAGDVTVYAEVDK